MKDEFLAVMSHELKNPLAVIQMNAQLLTRLPAFKVEPRAERVSGAIQSAVASQAQIIDDLLELSRATTGKLALAPMLLDLAELIRGIAEAVEGDARAKGHELSVAATEPLWAVADPVRVEQIVWNLLTNAVKFTPEGGRIEVRLARDGPMARLAVSDDGIGVDSRQLGGLFDMFKQVDTGAGRKKTGLGIGLALVRQLAELHGGRAEARSDGLGRGAEFVVWLPLAEGQEEHGAPDRRSAGSFKGLRLLLVDDERDLLEVFAELLASEGVQVSAADSAERALELASSAAFDAVVSDLAMPGRDGYWLAGELRRSESTRALPLVAVSGMAREADRAKALAAGFDAHLGKPLDIDALRRAIVAAAARRRDFGS